MEDKESVFCSKLEAGLSLLAVNLPSLWAYANKVSPERIVASIRSAILLRSLRSGDTSRASRSHTRLPDGDVAAHFNSSRARIFTDKQDVEVPSMQDLEAKRKLPLNQIWCKGLKQGDRVCRAIHARGGVQVPLR